MRNIFLIKHGLCVKIKMAGFQSIMREKPKISKNLPKVCAYQIRFVKDETFR